MRVLGFMFLPLAGFLPLKARAHPIAYESTPFMGSEFVSPNDGFQHTMILLLHGSEGGSRRALSGEAELLANVGFGVLMYCYFDCDGNRSGPSETLQNIELTTVQAAIRWLRQHPQGNGQVVVYGFSRGAELAMILGAIPFSLETRPTALIAHSPSDVHQIPFNWVWHDPSCWTCIQSAGQSSSCNKPTDFRWNPVCDPQNDPNQIDFTKSAWVLNGVSIPSGTNIEVEKYDGPILITVGTNDSVWPSEQTRRLEARLRQSGRSPEVIYFAGAGHEFNAGDELKRRNLVLEFLGRVLLGAP